MYDNYAILGDNVTPSAWLNGKGGQALEAKSIGNYGNLVCKIRFEEDLFDL